MSRENELTKYVIPTGSQFPTHQSVFVAALRGARAAQPIDRVIVQPTPGKQTDLAIFDVPSRLRKVR
jgi:hypothetical protein